MINFLECMRRVLALRAKTDAEILAFGEMMIEAMAERQEKFLKNRQKIEEDIKRGAHLTDHKITL